MASRKLTLEESCAARIYELVNVETDRVSSQWMFFPDGSNGHFAMLMRGRCDGPQMRLRTGYGSTPLAALRDLLRSLKANPTPATRGEGG